MRACLVALMLGVIAACSGEKSSGPKIECVVRGVTAGQTSYAMVVTQVVNVSATIEQSGCPALPELTWSSNDPAVVTAERGGVITAVGVGNAEVTARIEGRSEQVVVSVTVAGRVLGLTVSPSSAELPVNGTQQLDALVTADRGTPTAVTWRTSDATRATVSPTGLVTAIAAGVANITAVSTADTTRRAASQVTVRPRVLGISISPRAETLFVTATTQLNATVQGDSGVVTRVRWRSVNPGVASVSEQGLVTALGMGATEVIAESLGDSTQRAGARIVVLPRVLSVAVAPGVATIDVTATIPLVATVTGDLGASTAVVWSSSAPGRATVSATGAVTGVAMGTTIITARSVADPSKGATATVTVRPRVTGIAVAPSPATLVVGGTVQLNATVAGDSGIARGVTWSSTDVSKVSVSEAGVVTGIAVGSATITARSAADTTRAASALVSVVPRVTGVSVSPATTNLLVNGSITLVATVTGDPGAPSGVTWSSANPSVASVSAAGQVIATGAGSVTITATSVADVSRSGSATINVSAPPPPPFTDLCFSVPDPGNQRIAPTTTSRAGAMQLSLTCSFAQQVDLLAGQVLSVFPVVAGSPADVTWQLPPPSPVATLSASATSLQIAAATPGGLTVGAMGEGQAAQLNIRVLATAPSGFCVTVGAACGASASLTVRVGQPVTVSARAGGQGAAAVWSVAGPGTVLPHVNTHITFVPSTVGVYLVAGSATTGVGNGVALITVIP